MAQAGQRSNKLASWEDPQGLILRGPSSVAGGEGRSAISTPVSTILDLYAVFFFGSNADGVSQRMQGNGTGEHASNAHGVAHASRHTRATGLVATWCILFWVTSERPGENDIWLSNRAKMNSGGSARRKRILGEQPGRNELWWSTRGKINFGGSAVRKQILAKQLGTPTRSAILPFLRHSCQGGCLPLLWGWQCPVGHR